MATAALSDAMSYLNGSTTYYNYGPGNLPGSEAFVNEFFVSFFAEDVRPDVDEWLERMREDETDVYDGDGGRELRSEHSRTFCVWASKLAPRGQRARKAVASYVKYVYERAAAEQTNAGMAETNLVMNFHGAFATKIVVTSSISWNNPSSFAARVLSAGADGAAEVIAREDEKVLARATTQPADDQDQMCVVSVRTIFSGASAEVLVHFRLMNGVHSGLLVMQYMP